MAPIALKDKRIEELTKQLVKRFITGELAKKNVPVAVQFALSNFRYHKYLDADSNKVDRTIEGLCEKFTIHGQEHKSKSLSTLVEKFMSCALFDKQYGEKSDVHYALLKFLTVLSESPINAVYHQPHADQPEDVKDNFNWTKYLLEGEEKYIVHYYDTHEEEFWSDLESEDESDNENDQVLEGQDLDEDERKQLQVINRTVRHPEINGVTKEVRDILCENLVEAYWLTNESSRVAEETSEMSLASQWYE
ncbi:gamma-tubulin complex component 5-like [Paramuricea clavata]|uniref:Gamma-tubulin complex component 5-like n=1 Tax=Paramuricea clavata TaxID=317549 RepID=A0A7D9HQQ0_PARCT|nr:gamma-tubulin complex component 5-like [Paramuricea clavata]